MADLRAHRVRVNGVGLQVWEAGPEAGEPVVFLHGFPEFGFVWRDQMEALAARGYRVLAPDQRGYGRSDKPAELEKYRATELAADVAGLIAWTGSASAHVVGHDWGACVAWWTAILHPASVKTLSAINFPHPAVMRENLLGNPAQLSRSWYALLFQIPRMPEFALRLGDYRVLQETLRRSAGAGLFTEERLRAYREEWARPGALSAMINWYRAALRYPEKAPAAQVAPPTQLIWGDRDRFLGMELAAPSVARCERGRLIVVEGGSHWVHHEQPERISRLVSEFIGA